MQKRRAFLIHWKKEELGPKIRLLRAAGYSVATEHEDGARAGRNIKANLPDVIVIYLSRLPSHGRETAEYLAGAKATRQVPIVFVGGEPQKVAEVKARVPTGIFSTEARLESVLKKFIP